ncbi:MAG: sugar phosphate isomerase/epimerase family protein [Nitrososphaeraceae archaeon]
MPYLNMKLSFSSNAFKKFSLDNAIREIAKIGYKGVEILCDIPHAYPPEFSEEQTKKIKNLISDLDIRISNLNAFTLYAIGDVYHPSWIEADNKLREIRVKHTIDCIYLAKKLGAKNLSTEPGGPISIQKTEVGSHVLLKIFAEGLKKVKNIAEENNVKILVEPEPSLLIENSEQFLQLMKAICSDYIKLNFDIGHFYCVKEDPSETILKLIDYIEHFHLSDIAYNRVHYHLIPGIGSINFEQVFDTIKKIGYKGFVTVELYPYQDNPIYVAKQAYNYLKVFI